MGKLMIMDQICFLCANVWHHYHSIVCVTVIVNIRFCVSVFSWNLPGPENYALQYADGVQTYITESVSHICLQINTNMYLHHVVGLVNKCLSTSWRHWATDLSQPVRCFYVQEENVINLNHNLVSTFMTSVCFCENFPWSAWNDLARDEAQVTHTVSLMRLKTSVRQTVKNRETERKREKQLELHSASWCQVTFWKGCPLPLLSLGWRQACRRHYNTIR